MAQERTPYPTVSSIDAWLEGHPDDSTAYADSGEALSFRRSTLKRKALGDISSNAMPEKRRRISPFKAGASFEGPQTPLQPQRAPYSIPPDDDDTPRPPDEASNLHRSRNTNYAFSAGQTSLSRSSTSSARSRSPIKRMGDLQFMDRSIDVVSLDNPEYPLPPSAERLVGNMRKISGGKQVIPECLKVWLRHPFEISQYLHVIDISQINAERLIADGRLDSDSFGADSNNLIPAQPKNAHSDEEVWKRVSEVLYEARLCEENSSSEPAWNTEVHARILNLVLFGWREEWRLSYNDV
jgi:hypothetical protein